MDMHFNPISRVGVVGGSGYTGRELLAVLSGHDGVRVALASSRSEAGEPTRVPGLTYKDAGPEALAGLDLVFLALPHGEAVPWAKAALEQGVRVIDLTGDHRPGSGREAGAVYGLTERYGPSLADARLVANPGCYPTGVILALAPLVEAGLVPPDAAAVVSAASGTTGAGRSPKRNLLFSEVAGDFRAYGLGNEHRHLAEMRAELPGLDLLFVPHLLPVARGILETIAVPLVAAAAAADVRSIWREAYAGSPAVGTLDCGAPGLKDVVGTDRLVLSATDNVMNGSGMVTLVVALDNLGKGAAGQAVQNMNAMLGFEPSRGIRC